MGILSAIGGAASAIGGAASAYASAKAAKKATQMQIDWERERAQNAHQWEVQDLKAAGLNPILAAGGSGAVTGGISAPVPDTSGINTGISNAITALAVSKDNEKKDAEIKNIDTNSALQTTQEMKTYEEMLNVMKERGLISAKKQKEYTENMLKTAQTEQIYIELKYKKAYLENEIEKTQNEIKLLKEQKQFTKAAAKEKELNNKWRTFNELNDALNKWVNTGISAVNSAANMLESATPW